MTEFETRRAPFLARRTTASIRVYAFHGGAAEPIPFQIDERDPRGRFAFENGPAPNRDDTPGILDGNDLIVILNRDLGERGTPSGLPAGADAWGEVRVGAPQAALGYAYVGSFAEPPPTAPADRVHYDPDGDGVDAAEYSVAFGASPLPLHLAFRDEKGAYGREVLEAVRAHGEARILGGLIKLRRDERSLHDEIQGWRDGTVRVIRHGKYWIDLPLGFKARARVSLLFYPDAVEGRATTKVDIPPRLIPADGDLTAFFRFLDLRGARVLVANRPPSDPLDGHMTPAKRAYSGLTRRWAALLLPDGRTFLLAVRLEGGLRELEQTLYFDDSTGTKSSSGPSFGFRLGHVNRLDTGVSELAVTAMLVDSTDPAEIGVAAHGLLEPPPIEVEPLEMPANP
jgi:hypothetical protein